jgi:hypothetical protein
MTLDLANLTNTLLNFFTNHNHLLPNYIPDSNKVNILLWSVKDKSNTFILKIANQKYIGSARTDKNGERYWKFKEVEEEVIRTDESPPNSNPNSDAIAKFQERQKKSEQIFNGKFNPTINCSQQPEPISQ